MPLMLRRLSGALTDLAYLVLAASARARPLYRRWARIRYQRLAAVYDRVADHDPEYLASLHALLETVGSIPRWIVEVGAGTGAATAVLRARYPQAAIVVVDLSLPMLRHQSRTAPPVLHRVAGDAFALPLRPGSMDLVVAHNAPFDLAELTAVADPSGTVIVVLSSARAIPTGVRTRLLRGLPQDWSCLRERSAGSGVGWLFQARPAADGMRHAPTPTPADLRRARS